MTRARTQAACLASVEAERIAEHTPTYRLDEQIAAARRDMPPARWSQLNDEWNATASGARK